ncbi:MAG TPA: peptide deformylase [Terriglobia bacterium]|nr:peptide deformylase [Terriglobia bacterium]
MAIRPIVQFPDQRLRAVAEPVTVFDEALRSLAADLLDTIRAAPGIGITAPHIGIAKRLVILDLPGHEGLQAFANPAILWASAETIRHREGSVSMPGVLDEIERPARIRLQYQGLDGNQHVEEAEGLAAICHQHEIDQLDGIFWIQRLSSLKRQRLIKRYEKILKSQDLD